MIPYERVNSLELALKASLDGRQETIHTALPGIIKAWDPTTWTVSCQPTIQVNLKQKDGTVKLTTLPLLVNCPVQFQGNSDVFLCFNPEPNDECLIIFAERCIDSWWSQGGVSPPAEFRMHDLSDGFCLPRVSSKPNVPGTATPAGTIELRDKARDVAIGLNVNGTAQLTNAAGFIRLTSDGNVHASGTIYAADFVNTANTSLTTHVHPTAPTGPVSIPTPGS